jgi:hypothetical protein
MGANTNPAEISFPKKVITEEDINVVKEYLKEKREPILFTYQINGIERKGAIVLSEEKYLSLGYVAIQIDKIWNAIKDKKTLEEQQKEILKYLQEVEELISFSNKVKEIFDNKAEIRYLSLFPEP